MIAIDLIFARVNTTDYDHPISWSERSFEVMLDLSIKKIITFNVKKIIVETNHGWIWYFFYKNSTGKIGRTRQHGLQVPRSQ
jgi:hypothetical protein